MTTATACCAHTIPLHRPWWQRLADHLRTAWDAEADPYRSLRHLSPETLRDIGAPGFVRDERAERDRWLLDLRNW